MCSYVRPDFENVCTSLNQVRAVARCVELEYFSGRTTSDPLGARVMSPLQACAKRAHV